MNAVEFVKKWRGVSLSERSACHEHFIDVCHLVDHKTPVEADQTGETFTFEKGAKKQDGGSGWADVWKKGFFGWEYKKRHADLDKAYEQLLRYRESLENPPLLIVSDMDRIIIHGNFTNAIPSSKEIMLKDLSKPECLELLRSVFFEPEKLRPERTREAITSKAARQVADLAQRLRQRGNEPQKVAQFLDRIVFCMFAEDIGLLHNNLFSALLESTRRDPIRFKHRIKRLFTVMAKGGDYGNDEVYHFNGNLFSGSETLELQEEELQALYRVSKLDWSAVDPSIFGTLFERGLDPDKRSQLGAHYTHRDDIRTIVEPVVIAPLREQWTQVRAQVLALIEKFQSARAEGKVKLTPKAGSDFRKKATSLLGQFLDHLAKVRILDPACGSGNFLYVSLQMLKDLEKDVIVWAGDQGLGPFVPQVSPSQLYGIETNRYAYDLAQMTVWIGFIQWTRGNGYTPRTDPVLGSMESNFYCMDAILDESKPDAPSIREWPEVDFIVGNPPFLGGKRLRADLGDTYVDRLFAAWKDRVPAEADYCCYWFEQARQHIAEGRCLRAGLLATQGIRGGANRQVLKQIKQSGDIFFAESDRPWILNGANVHVSMVGFSDGEDSGRVLDGKAVNTINADLTSGVDVTKARLIPANADIAFMGDSKGGDFDIPESLALEFLHDPNPHGIPNSNVLVPWTNGDDLTGRSRSMWIIDFGPGTTEDSAARFQGPFEYAKRHVKPQREGSRSTVGKWWQHERARTELRSALTPLLRFFATVRVSKHRLFEWMEAPTLPDSSLFAFARDDSYSFGVLHSRIHEVWSRRQATQLREAESGTRYTPRTCFLTFPFPNPTEAEQIAIGEAAKKVSELRERWLSPPEWTKTEVLEFPGTMEGPWARFVHEPNAEGIGTVRYERLIPKDSSCAALLQARTLTNLYNERPEWLANAHARLDEAVFEAYGWQPTLNDEEILERLLTLNLERTAS